MATLTPARQQLGVVHPALPGFVGTPWLGVALVIALFVGRASGWSLANGAQFGGADVSAVAAVSAVLVEAQTTLATGDAVLAQRDANPGLVESPQWLATHEQVTLALEAEYQQAQQVKASGSSVGLQQCVANGLRLVSTAHRAFQQAFQMGGHGAYYFSAHANWNLNLGKQDLASCWALRP